MWRKLWYGLFLDKYKRGYGGIVRNKVVQGMALAWPVAFRSETRWFSIRNLIFEDLTCVYAIKKVKPSYSLLLFDLKRHSPFRYKNSGSELEVVAVWVNRSRNASFLLSSSLGINLKFRALHFHNSETRYCWYAERDRRNTRPSSSSFVHA